MSATRRPPEQPTPLEANLGPPGSGRPFWRCILEVRMERLDNLLFLLVDFLGALFRPFFFFASCSFLGKALGGQENAENTGKQCEDIGFCGSQGICALFAQNATSYKTPTIQASNIGNSVTKDEAYEKTNTSAGKQHFRSQEMANSTPEGSFFTSRRPQARPRSSKKHHTGEEKRPGAPQEPQGGPGGLRTSEFWRPGLGDLEAKG